MDRPSVTTATRSNHNLRNAAKRVLDFQRPFCYSGDMKYKQIFWDNDGVLVDTEKYYLMASREALASVSIDLSDAQFASLSISEGRSVFDIAEDAGIDKETIEELRLWRNRRYAEILTTEPVVVDGAEETLKALHDKIPMAVVTSSLQQHFAITHQKSGLLDYIDFFLTREDYHASKPSPESYLLALHKSGCRAEDVLVIEDSPRGLTAAKKAGLTCWVIPGDYTLHSRLGDADRILEDITEISRLLL